MFLPTRKLLLLLLAPAMVLLIAPRGTGLVVALCLNLAILLLAMMDWLLSARPSDFVITRHMPRRLSLGGPNRIGWELRNNSRHDVAFRITETRPENIDAEKPFIAGRIAAQSRADLMYHVRPTRRGRYEFGDVFFRYRSVLGLIERQFQRPLRTEVKVYPNVANLARYQLALQRHRRNEIGLRTVRQRGKGSLFESLRDYLPGDDRADIAWKATARRDQLMVRTFETERSQNVLLVLDCGRLMTTQVDHISRLDYAINASILLTYVAMRQGDNIGVLAFSDRVMGYVPPIRGKAALGRINEALYQLEPSLTEPNYEEACRFLALRHRKRSLIVIFTDVLGKDASSALLAHAARFARHHLPVCVTMRNLEVEALSEVKAHATETYVSKAVSLQVLQRRQEALLAMRRAGVDVLDVDPRGMTPVVLNHYLELKRRRRI